MIVSKPTTREPRLLLAERSPTRFEVGIALTIIWLFIIGVFAVTRDASIWSLKANEFGDFLAGTVAPVAFFWLILGYRQQGDELRLQAEQLSLQVQEMEQLVTEAANQARAAAGMFEIERENQRIEHRREILLSQPRFELEPPLATHHGQGTQFALKNVGAAASDLRLTHDSSLLSAQLGSGTTTLVQRGHAISLNCHFHQGQTPNSFVLHLSYLDQNAEPRTSEVHWRGGSVHVVQPDPFEDLPHLRAPARQTRLDPSHLQSA